MSQSPFPIGCASPLRAISALLLGGMPLLQAQPLAPGVLHRAPVTSPTDGAEEDYRYLSGLVERELWDLAVKAGQEFLRQHTGDERETLARYHLAGALFALQQHAEALPHWKRLARISDFAYRLEAEFRAGECALALNDNKAAAEHFRRVLKGDQSYLHGAAEFLLGEASFRAGDFAAAEAAYDRHVKRFEDAPTVPDARRALAWCAWERGVIDETIKRARFFLERYGDDTAAPEVHVLLGEALLETDDPRTALAAFRAALRDPEQGAAALRGAGFALAALNKPAEAAQSFGSVLQRYPGSPLARECRLQKGAQLIAAGMASQAAEALAPLASKGDAEGALWLGRALAQSGDHEHALAALERGLGNGPSEELRGQLQVARGNVLQTLGRSEAARAAFAEGNSDYALHAAAVAALNSGDPKAAEDFAETLLKRGEAAAYRAPTLLVLAEARFSRERWDAAEEAFRLALAQAEDDAARSRARSRMAWCRYLSGDLEAAARGFGELARQMPQAPEAEEAARMAARSLEENGSPAHGAWRDYLQRFDESEHTLEALIALARTTDDEAEQRAALLRAADLDREGDLGARALLDLAESLAQSGDADGAQARFGDLLRRVEGRNFELEARARYGLAWGHFDREQFGRAAEILAPMAEPRHLETLRNIDGELTAAALELLVWSLARAERAAQATTVLGRLVLGSRPLMVDAERRFGVTHTVAEAWLRAGDPLRGVALYEQLLASLDTGPQTGDVSLRCWIEGAYLALEADRLEEAEALLRRAHERAPDDPRVLEACFFVGEALLEADDDRRALALFGLASRPASPLAADALYRAGFTQLQAGASAEAEGLFSALVEQHPKSPLLGETLFLLGEARYRAGKFTAAIAALERVRREHPRHAVRPKALFRLGLALGHEKRWDSAAEVLAELATAFPSFENLAEAELWRGRSLAALSRGRAARAALERVLRLDDGALAAEARVVKGDLLLSEERFEDALSEYLKVAVLYTHPPAVAQALLGAGQALEQLERPEDAARRYAEVLERYAGSPWARSAQQALDRLRGSR